MPNEADLDEIVKGQLVIIEVWVVVALEFFWDVLVDNSVGNCY